MSDYDVKTAKDFYEYNKQFFNKFLGKYKIGYEYWIDIKDIKIPKNLEKHKMKQQNGIVSWNIGSRQENLNHFFYYTKTLRLLIDIQVIWLQRNMI